MSDTNNQSKESANTNVTMNIDNKPEPPENVTIPFILLTNLHNIMVAAGDRGAFKTAEMYDIGRVYREVQEHLTQHLRNVGQNQTMSSETASNTEVVDASTLPDPEMEKTF
tara:strand:- start:41 stop:373 length:333 start_codon:yes stop_codon:yes gene_type:complete